jgi:protein-tyrosine phosphatase
MIPLADTHCHLLAGLDDGPRTAEEVLAMCRIAYEEGTRAMAATSHQSEKYDVAPQTIRDATRLLSAQLLKAEMPLTVYPVAEVMAFPDMEQAFAEGRLLSFADRGQFLLIEMPHRLFVDLRPTAEALRAQGVRPIIAHAERQPELLHEPGLIETHIEAGCLVQVSSGSIVHPRSGADLSALRDWFRRGVVHLLGSDAHNPSTRPPRMAEAYHQIARWTSPAVADRICSTNGLALFQGLNIRFGQPEPRRRRWFPQLW